MDGMSINPLPAGMPGMDGRIESLARQAGIAGDDSMTAAATEFEGLFLSMMMKEMRNSLGEDSLFGGESSDIYGGLFDMMLSQSMAESQPLGIARLLQSQMGYKPELPAEKNGGDQSQGETVSGLNVDIDA